MLKYEDQNTEFKQEYVTDIKKEVVAFANSAGGTVYIGIRRDGVAIGVDNPDGEMLQVANSLKDSIKPDIMSFIEIQPELMNGKTVIAIQVSAGTNRPYYLGDKGLRPGGVYVRKGSSSQPVTDEGIREMIKDNSGTSFETGRSLKQELTFRFFEQEMRNRSLELGDAQMRTLKLVGEDGLYTNLAYLLSDQCGHTIKVALFQGNDKAIFRDRKEFTGSVLKQLENVYQFLDLNNKTKATFSGLNRTDVRDYPEDALREALLNCCVHRDYSLSGSTLINIYDNRIEFVSLGGLVPGLELKSIFMGVSISRNPNLAAVFYRMRLIESYGTGIGKIERLYSDIREKPVFETAKGVFRVTLPNRNENNEIQNNIVRESDEKVAGKKQKQIISDFARESGEITRKEVEQILGVGATKAFHLLKDLCDDKILETKGKGKLSRYVPR